MNPYDEQRLRDEVIYLHSLWHKGPPNSLSTKRKRTSSLLSPSADSNPSFDSKKRNKKKKEKKRTTMAATASRSSDSGAPWPCPAPTQVPSHSGWPETRPVYPRATAQEVETHSALKIQLRACSVFREVFVEAEEDDEDEEEDYWVDIGEEKFRFFLRIFSEDGELRRYYEANREGGEYCCFVCGGLGKGKRFKSCLGLAQHSAAMSKAERNRSHWAFGQVVCRVLGWDFDRIPTVVLKGEPLGRSLDNAGAESRGESVGGDGRENVVAVKDNGRENEKPDESVGGVVRENIVAADGDGSKSVELEGIENLQIDNGKDHVNCKGSHKDAKIGIDMGISEMEGNENKAIDEKCSKGEDKHDNEDEEEDPSEEDPSENEDEEEDPSEDGNEHENKDENESVSEDSTVLKSGGLGQPSAKLGDSQESIEPPVSSYEAVEKSPSAVLEWPSIASASVVSLISAEEEANIAADRLQYKAVRACQEFFRTNSGLDGGEFDSEDDEEKDGTEDIDSEDEDTDASKDSKVFNFLSDLFTERVELREFYVNNHESSDFCCLVCGGIGKKVWKRFTGCVALVQHSAAISRTKKKLAHRAYGQVICQVLGRDMSRFPSLASRVESPAQAHTLHESCKLQGAPEENPDCHKDDIGCGKSDSLNGDGVEIVLEKDSGIPLNDM